MDSALEYRTKEKQFLQQLSAFDQYLTENETSLTTSYRVGYLVDEQDPHELVWSPHSDYPGEGPNGELLFETLTFQPKLFRDVGEEGKKEEEKKGEKGESGKKRIWSPFYPHEPGEFEDGGLQSPNVVVYKHYDLKRDMETPFLNLFGMSKIFYAPDLVKYEYRLEDIEDSEDGHNSTYFFDRGAYLIYLPEDGFLTFRCIPI